MSTAQVHVSTARPPVAVAAVRTAVRRFLAAHRTGDAVVVACSGGADSLALAAATVHCAGRLGLAVHGLVVDHRLQADSQRVAQTTARQLCRLGTTEVRVLEVTVAGPGGLEAAARRARYAALRAACPVGALVLLGHTLDDQAETVLLGLGRGSGPRSLAGMRELDPPWGRPLLGVRRAVTVAACAELGLTPWADPHNDEPRFRRVRLRTEVLPLLEDVLCGGVAQALARTAAQLREDLDLLEDQAHALLSAAAVDPAATATEGTDVLNTPGVALRVPVLDAAPAPVRRRALRRWLLDAGVPELTDAHLRATDDLVGRWSGQGAVWLPGESQVYRARGKLHLS
ncbi:MAG: tRNA lysidine(34) synthetase TilS [Pseudonocardiaceae bacterium]